MSSDLVDTKGHPRVDNIDGFAFCAGLSTLRFGDFFSLDLNWVFFTGGSNDSTRTGDDQDDASLD